MGGRPAAVRSSALAIACLSCLIALAASAGAAQALPPGFTESATISGLELPTAVRFAPGGQVIVAEKSGLIKTFDSLSDPSATTVADLRTEVYNSWDRGLLGIELDPGFASNHFLYALYTRNAKIGGASPFWPTLDGTNDDCPGPVVPPDALKPGPVNDGCVASGRLVRLQLSPSLGSVTSSQTLIEDQWCQQFPSHSIGSMAFDSQGRLYVSAGDGASFSSSDWGQFGIPRNPCGDPPGGVGAILTPPTAEGGALRSQDLRTPA
ncbi:MAG: PQQ-dependent sugar dehydrogenase, partial [Solirubrobacterales bacterium]